MNRMRLPHLHRSLAAPGHATACLAQWALAAIVAGAILVTGWLWWDSQALEERAARYESSAGRIQEANRQFAQESLRAGFDLSDTRLKTLSREIVFARHVTEQRAFSWTQFLGALEEAVPPRISINSVALSPKEAVISLNGSALTLSDVTTFVNALENHRAFRNVVLSQHRIKEPVKDGEQHMPSRQTVEFTLTVMYKPAGPSPLVLSP
jgi:Tfp pilus assembly protein PilN